MRRRLQTDTRERLDYNQIQGRGTPDFGTRVCGHVSAGMHAESVDQLRAGQARACAQAPVPQNHNKFGSWGIEDWLGCCGDCYYRGLAGGEPTSRARRCLGPLA